MTDAERAQLVARLAYVPHGGRRASVLAGVQATESAMGVTLTFADRGHLVDGLAEKVKLLEWIGDDPAERRARIMECVVVDTELVLDGSLAATAFAAA